MKNKISTKYVLILILILIIMYSLVQFSTNMDEGYTNQFSKDASGNSLCLDLSGNNIEMRPCGNFTGQQWTSTPWANTSYYKLQNKSDTTKCLNNNLKMFKCVDNSSNGQRWILPTAENPKFQNAVNSMNCLDVINDGTNNKLQMAACANVSGQNWSQKT